MHLQVSHTSDRVSPADAVAVTFLFAVINIDDFSVRDHNEIFDVCNDFHIPTLKLDGLPPFEPCAPPPVPQAHSQMRTCFGVPFKALCHNKTLLNRKAVDAHQLGHIGHGFWQ